MSLPKDPKQIPDIFINFYEDQTLGKKRIAYIRLDPIDLFKQKTNVKVCWHELKIIDFEQRIDDNKIYSLFSINFGLAKDFENSRPIRLSAQNSKFIVWCNILQVIIKLL